MIWAGDIAWNQTCSNEWAQYSINVLVPQIYVIETRVAGIGTNGAFKISFATNGTNYANTGPLTITTTNWTNLPAVVSLNAGTNVMTLTCLSNGTDGAHVGRFNYISVYPYLPTPTVGTGNQYPMLNSGTDYSTASNNAVAIQNAVNNLGSGGGTVWITNGTNFVSQASPNEANDAFQNAAVSITNSNVQIRGEGQTNTTLIAYNRATTVFSLGKGSLSGITFQAQCVNFTLRDMTIEAQPHRAVSSGTNTVYNPGQLSLSTNAPEVGALNIFYGPGSNQFAYNILVTNCQFLSADRSIEMPCYISNVMIRACNFVPSGGFDTWGSKNVYTGQSNVDFEVSIWVRGGGCYNLVVLENTYDGNISDYEQKHQSSILDCA